MAPRLLMAQPEDALGLPVCAGSHEGARILQVLQAAQRLNQWMADALRPHVGSRVLEIGAGIGNITRWLVPRERYLVTDIDPQYLGVLQRLARETSNLSVARVDLDDPASFHDLAGRFDTVICLNVLEHVKDPRTALRNVARTLEPGGRLLLYVPQHQALYSSLDEALEHRCRYSMAMLAGELGDAGFRIEQMQHFIRSGVPGWILNGHILRRRYFSPTQVALFDRMVPLLRRVDHLLPLPGLGILAVAARAR